MTPAALILAGSRGGTDPLALSEGVSHKSLIVLHGKCLLERVVAALREAGISRIAVSADDPVVTSLALRLGAEVLPTGSGPSESVARAFTVLGAPLLVTTSDHALLDGAWITGFLEDTAPESDVALMMARRSLVESALPGSRRTWLRFADDDWSGCNLFLLATPRAAAAITTWQMVEANRKRPWRIAMRLGPATLLSYLARRLSLAEAAVRLGRRVGVQAQVVPASSGLAAIDVDKLSDLADVRRLVAGGQAITYSASGSAPA